MDRKPKRIAALLDEYEQGARIRGIKPTQEFALRPIRAAWGNKRPKAIDTAAVALYVRERIGDGMWTKRGRPASAPTVRRELGAYAAAMRWCIKKRLLSETEYVEPDLPPAGAPREVFLTGSEADDLISRAVIYDHEHGTKLGLFCAIAIDECARAEAIETLPWDRVSFDRDQIDFRDPTLRVTKKRREVVPMSLRVRDLLHSALYPTGSIVPAKRLDELVVGPITQHEWAKFIATTPFKDRGLTRHDLRRTGASLLVARGVDIMRVAKVLGDHPATVLKHYARFAPDYLNDVHPRPAPLQDGEGRTTSLGTPVLETAGPEVSS